MTTNNAWNSDYNSANGTLLIGNGTRPVVGTLTAGAGISVVNGAGTITITNTGGGGGVSLSPYIVGPTNSDFTTISAAITQAIADGASTTNQINIYVKPQSGGYTENLTLADGINIVGLVGDSCSSSNLGGTPRLEMPTQLNGNITFGNGVNTVTNIQINSGALNTLIFTGTSGNRRYGINNVISSSLAGIAIEIQQSLIDVFVQGSNLRAPQLLSVAAGGGNQLKCHNSQFTGVTDSTVGAGATLIVSLADCLWEAPLAGASATISMVAYHSNINVQASLSSLIVASVATLSTFNSVCLSDNADLIVATTGGISCKNTLLKPLPISSNFTGSVELTQCSYSDATQVQEIYRAPLGSVFKGTFSERNQEVVQTTNATPATIATIPVLDDEMVGVLCRYTAFRSDFAAAQSGTLICTGRAAAGTATLAGTPVSVPSGDAALVTASISAVASGANIQIQVTGIAATTINWSVDYEVLHTQSNA